MLSVENGTRLTGETAGALHNVVKYAREVVISVDKISVAAKEQAASIEQVTMGVDQISSVVQNNSATAEESAAASEELSGQAQMLNDLVKHFQLRKDEQSLNVQPALEEDMQMPSIQLAGSKY